MLEVVPSDVHFAYVVARDIRQFFWPIAAAVPDAAECHCHCEVSAAVPVSDVCGPLERLLAAQLGKPGCPPAARCPSGPVAADWSLSPWFSIGLGLLLFVFLVGFACGSLCVRGRRAAVCPPSPSTSSGSSSTLLARQGAFSKGKGVVIQG
jgi:hypothetical protein